MRLKQTPPKDDRVRKLTRSARWESPKSANLVVLGARPARKTRAGLLRVIEVQTHGRRTLGWSGGLDKAELGQRLDAVVKTDFLGDLAVLNAQHRGACEVHLPAGRGRQRAHQEVAEGRTGVRTAAFPLADDIVAFCDQIRRAPAVEIGGSGAARAGNSAGGWRGEERRGRDSDWRHCT